MPAAAARRLLVFVAGVELLGRRFRISVAVRRDRRRGIGVGVGGLRGVAVVGRVRGAGVGGCADVRRRSGIARVGSATARPGASVDGCARWRRRTAPAARGAAQFAEPRLDLAVLARRRGAAPVEPRPRGRGASRWSPRCARRSWPSRAAWSAVHRRASAGACGRHPRRARTRRARWPAAAAPGRRAGPRCAFGGRMGRVVRRPRPCGQRGRARADQRFRPRARARRGACARRAVRSRRDRGAPGSASSSAAPTSSRRRAAS